MHNPVLDPVKAYIRKRGGAWPRYAFNLPNTPRAAVPPGEAAPAMHVYCLAQNDGRRFAVRAFGYVEALNRLNVLLS